MFLEEVGCNKLTIDSWSGVTFHVKQVYRKSLWIPTTTGRKETLWEKNRLRITLTEFQMDTEMQSSVRGIRLLIALKEQ